MIRVYHRPGGLSARVLIGLALASLAAVSVVELFPHVEQAPHYEEKLVAAKKAQASFALLQAEKVRLGLPRARREDVSETGLIGPQGSLIATSAGALGAKLTANNPNFAALIIDYLKELKLKRGDVVAVGYSGSFPGINVAVLAALETLGLVPLIITSAAASDHGASDPSFSWLDMERLLKSAGAIHATSIAASLGGIEDQALGMSAEGRATLLKAIELSHAEPIVPGEFEESIERRIAIYEREAKGRRIAAYVNVGGGAVSVGHSRGKSTYDAGLNRPGAKPFVDSVIGRFLERGVPVIHLVRIATLAREYGLPAPPRGPLSVGEGALFSERRPNRWLALGSLVVLVGLLLRARRDAVAPEETTEPTTGETV